MDVSFPGQFYLPIVPEIKDGNHRRISEEHRKMRIFNPKRRQIGIDVEALNHQVHEHNLAREKVAEEERKDAENARKSSDLALFLEQQQRNEMQEQCKKIDKFRLSVQRPECRRDFDLYDPNQKKREHPPRVSDYDNCPVSGIQRLQGEDLDYIERHKKQKDLVRDLLLQQIQQKRMQNLRQDKVQQNWESSILQQDSYALKLSNLECNNSKNASTMLSDCNRKLSLQKQENIMHQKIQQESKNKREIEFTFYGDMLSENPAVAQSTAGPHRILPNRWKGMSKSQLEDYYKDQRQQVLENQRRKEKEQQERVTWNNHIMGRQNTSQFLDRMEKMHNQQRLKMLESENQQLAQEQRQQQAYLKKIVYTNTPSKDYFDQFNTSSR